MCFFRWWIPTAAGNWCWISLMHDITIFLEIPSGHSCLLAVIFYFLTRHLFDSWCLLGVDYHFPFFSSSNLKSFLMSPFPRTRLTRGNIPRACLDLVFFSRVIFLRFLHQHEAHWRTFHLQYWCSYKICGNSTIIMYHHWPLQHSACPLSS